MSTPRVALVTVGSLLLLAASAPVALGASGPAPTITLDKLEPVYLQVRPWVAMAFIGMGLVAAISRLWQVLGSVGGTNLLGGGSSGAPNTLGGVFTTMLLIIATVAGAILLLYTWVDIVNATIGILWSIMESSPVSEAASSVAPPPVSVAPGG